MLWINLKIALRNLRKNKVYALINIGGLTIGLTIYLFGNLIIDYERTHDEFFAKSDRIVTIGSSGRPESVMGGRRGPATFSALMPILEAELTDIEAIARTLSREFVVGNEEQGFYENVIFADADFLKIFSFNYLHGDASALDHPNRVLLTDSAAIRYFGRTDVLGEILTLNNEHNFSVSGVIQIPPNSHFNPDVGSDFEIISSVASLVQISRTRYEGNWSNLGGVGHTYVLLPPRLDATWLQNQLDAMFDSVTAENAKRVIDGYIVSPLTQANLAMWDSMNFPAMEIIELLCLLVLLTAAVNYTNMAVAQSLGRSREVGMRKVVGASKKQLFTQFLVESLVIVSLAMLCSIAILEIVIPAYNTWGSDSLVMDYHQTLVWMGLTTLFIALLAGAYPAWLIARASPVDALRDIARKGRSGGLVRSTLVGAQFAISAFMLAVVAIMFAQNKTVEQASYIFPRSEIYTLHRLEANVSRLTILREELEKLPNIESVGFSSQIPYEQNNNTFLAGLTPGDEARSIRFNEMMIAPEFFEAYDIPIIAGRNFDRSRNIDEFHRITGESPPINVVINELAATRLGFSSALDAVGQRVYPIGEIHKFSEAVVVGVVPTQNIQGLFSDEKPWMFLWSMDQDWMDTASIRIAGGNYLESVQRIEDVWNRVIPDYPMNGRFLDEDFNRIFNVMVGMNKFIGFFALVAMLLSMVGLLGLTIFYVKQKTKEIGIRKTLGASSSRIVQMLIWQLSKPLAIALIMALPAAMLASNFYLNLFADRIDSSVPILFASGVISAVIALSTMIALAYRAAKSNPINALRHE